MSSRIGSNVLFQTFRILRARPTSCVLNNSTDHEGLIFSEQRSNESQMKWNIFGYPTRQIFLKIPYMSRYEA